MLIVGLAVPIIMAVHGIDVKRVRKRARTEQRDNRRDHRILHPKVLLLTPVWIKGGDI